MCYDLGSGSPPAQVVAILKPAALSYLEVESTCTQNINEDDPFVPIDRSNIETDFDLSQKSFALTINAVSMLASNRPTFFKDSATCLARRAVDPPSDKEHTNLTKAGILAVRSHLRASCLTLLRNSLSITTNAANLLHAALSSDICNMNIQADKARNMAEQAARLKTAGRAARNRAAVFYEWDQSGGQNKDIDDSSRKRKAAGNDALEKMRLAKLARGLGNGIQLPKSMSDACELILVNLSNLPSSRVAVTSKDKKSQGDQKRKKKMNFDSFVDAVMSNGASLVSDESRWYQRDGGDAWMMEIVDLVSEDEDGEKNKQKKSEPTTISFMLDTSTLDAASAKMKDEKTDKSKLYSEQCDAAAADAFERILSRTKTARDTSVIEFGNELAARLAWSMKNVKPTRTMNNINAALKTEDSEAINGFADKFPLVASSLKYDLETSNNNTTNPESKSSLEPTNSLSSRVLHEAYVTETSEDLESPYNKTLEYYISCVLESCKMADNKPNDNQRKKLANTASTSLPQQLAYLPSLPTKSLELTSALCDIDSVTKKAVEAAKKSSNQNLSQAASAHGKNLYLFVCLLNHSVLSQFTILMEQHPLHFK